MKTRAIVFLALVSVAVPDRLPAAGGPPPRLLADFEDPALPVGTEALVRAPSTVTARRVPDDQGQAFEVSGRHVRAGLAGLRVTFQDSRGRAVPVDASRHDYLTFRIRARGGPTRVQVQLVDAASLASGQAADAGELTRFLPQGLSPEWLQVAIPLGGLGVNRKALSALVLLVSDPVDFTLVVDDVALKREPEDALPPPRPRRGVP
jgi:hypothetical protein